MPRRSRDRLRRLALLSPSCAGREEKRVSYRNGLRHEEEEQLDANNPNQRKFSVWPTPRIRPRKPRLSTVGVPKIQFIDQKGTRVTLVARTEGDGNHDCRERSCPWIKRMFSLGVRAESSRPGRVCPAVGLRNPPSSAQRNYCMINGIKVEG